MITHHVFSGSHSNIQTRRGPIFHGIEYHRGSHSPWDSVGFARAHDLSQKPQYHDRVVVIELIPFHQCLHSIDVYVSFLYHLFIVALRSIDQPLVIEVDNALEVTARCVKYLTFKCCIANLEFLPFGDRVRSRPRAFQRHDTLTWRCKGRWLAPKSASWALHLTLLLLLVSQRVWSRW